jgi:hypothetical protein
MSNNLKKLVKVDENGQVHEIYSEYYVDMPENHARKIPIDHPDLSIITSKLVDGAVTTEKIRNQNVTTDKIKDDAIVTNKIKNLNVTYEKLNDDLNLHGKVVVVDTPWNTGSGNGTSDGGNSGSISTVDTYTRSVIDNKLNGKANVIHNHSKNDIIDFPVSLKNPEKLIINGEEYDGSSQVNLALVSPENLASMVEIYTGDFSSLLDTKAPISHTHSLNNIIDLYTFFYMKSEVDEKIQQLESIIESLTQRIEVLEAGPTFTANKDIISNSSGKLEAGSPTDTAKFIPNTDPGTPPDGYTAIWVG